MEAPLPACREPTGSYNILPEMSYDFNIKRKIL